MACVRNAHQGMNCWDSCAIRPLKGVKRTVKTRPHVRNAKHHTNWHRPVHVLVHKMSVAWFIIRQTSSNVSDVETNSPWPLAHALTYTVRCLKPHATAHSARMATSFTLQSSIVMIKTVSCIQMAHALTAPTIINYRLVSVPISFLVV